MNTPTQTRVRIATLLFTASLLCGSAAAQSVTILPFELPSGYGTGVSGLSSDGRTVTGVRTVGLGNPNHVYSWTAATGLYDITANEAGFFSRSTFVAMSGDGHTIAADGGYRWTGPGTGQYIGNLHFPNNSGSQPAALSTDGTVIVGTDHFSPGGMGDSTQGYRWTVSGGYQGLPLLEAYDCNADGNLVVGLTDTSHSGIWNAATGMVQSLPALSGATGTSTYARGMNFDGSIAVGVSGSNTLPTLWRNGIPMSLGLAPGGQGSSLETGVTPDGGVVIGSIGGGIRATVWTQATGNLLATDYLAMFGITIPSNWNLIDSRGVSDDGRTFLFQGFGQVNGINKSTGILVTIPAPGSVLVVGVAILHACRRRRGVPSCH